MRNVYQDSPHMRIGKFYIHLPCVQAAKRAYYKLMGSETVQYSPYAFVIKSESSITLFG